MTVPYTFATASTSIPLQQLDLNFATPITLGNTAIYLGNTTSTLGNVTLTNCTIVGGNVAANVTITGGSINNVSLNNVIIVNGTINNVTHTGGALENMTLGLATPNTVKATVLTVTSSSVLGNATANQLNNTPIGNNSQANGSFTNLVSTVSSNLVSVNIASVTTTFPNSYLANSSTTLGNTALTLGSTTSAVGNVTLNNASHVGGTYTNANIISLTAPITPTQGGTGLTTLTANSVIIGNGTANVTFVAPGSSGNVLASNGTAWISQAAGAASGNVTIGNTTIGLGTTALSIGNLTLSNATILGIQEPANVTATAANATINVDILSNVVLYLTSNAAGNWTVNFRGNSGTTFNNVVQTNTSVSATVLATNGSTPYYNANVTIDGTGVTPKWQGGTAPTSGNANSTDTYSYVVIKTAANVYTVLASQTQFK